MRQYVARITLSCLPWWEGLAFAALWHQGHWVWAIALGLVGSVAFFALLDAFYVPRKRGA